MDNYPIESVSVDDRYTISSSRITKRFMIGTQKVVDERIAVGQYEFWVHKLAGGFCICSSRKLCPYLSWVGGL